MENIHVKFEGEGDTFTLLQGEALEQKPPEKIILSGDIKTVSSFLNVRFRNKYSQGLQEVNYSKAIVIVNKEQRKISLYLDPENFYGASVHGELQETEELKQFHINQVLTFSKDQLVKLIKFNKLYFADAGKHAEMLLAFQRVSSTINISSKDSGDDRGNKERRFVKEVTSTAPTEFILNIPIFKGFTPARFRVDICLDGTEGSARFWFESIELHEIMIRQIDEIFAEQLESCKGFVIVNK